MDLFEARNELIHAVEKAGIKVPWAEFGPISGEFGVTLDGDEYKVTVRRIDA